MSSSPPTWITDWLSAGRYSKYLDAAGGNHDRALALYEWNAKLTTGLLRDLGHLEVGLRNYFDRALLAHPELAGSEWIDSASIDVLFPPHLVEHENGGTIDKNNRPRKSIKTAKQHAGFTETNDVHRGKVIAEFSFGFWTYLTDSLHEKTIWVPTLHNAFLPGTDRGTIHNALTPLKDVRNRLAHNETVFDRKPEDLRRKIVYVSRNISLPLMQHIVENSSVTEILKQRPY